MEILRALMIVALLCAGLLTTDIILLYFLDDEEVGKDE